MREFARVRVGDGDEMAHGAVAAGLGLGSLNQPIRRLDTAVGELGIKGVEDAVPMGFLISKERQPRAGTEFDSWP